MKPLYFQSRKKDWSFYTLSHRENGEAQIWRNVGVLETFPQYTALFASPKFWLSLITESVVTVEQKLQSQQQAVAGVTWRKGAAPKDGGSSRAVA